jgi:hypothetical protein
MEMNEILNSLNSCESSDSFGSINSRRDCSDEGSGFSNGFGNGCGNGFGSWIWILLILFYSSGNRGNNYSYDRKGKHDCCCDSGYGNVGGYGNVSGYLFLLVILFLCNGCRNERFGSENIFGGCC